MDADLLMQTVADVLKKIAEYSISNRAEFEALVKKSLAMQQADKVKKQQKRIPQITTRLEQIDKVLNKLYEDNALGTIPQHRLEEASACIQPPLSGDLPADRRRPRNGLHGV